MGTIKQGILGGFSGKVGTVVGGSWKGISYMRSLAQNVKNPRTDAQMTQRSKFALTLAFLKPITNYVRVGFKPYATKQTAFNAAMSYIVANAVSGEYPNHTLDFAKVLVSRGSLFPVENASAEADAGKITISWTDNSGISDALPTDVAMPLVFNPLKVEAVFSTSAAARADGMAEINLPADWAGDNVEVYLGFVSADGKAIANSIYLGEKTLI
ncbi:MAG TPA: DUF6266 family protein [Dysgonamonadaceae bacterium]|jgi:hypothetical protein|nr:DUF6266 family protein [Dysgonamonadaceae bacterium]HOV36924.1 DUF6266 family protein [Dysgonamonadaceae bacterium]